MHHYVSDDLSIYQDLLSNLSGFKALPTAKLLKYLLSKKALP